MVSYLYAALLCFTLFLLWTILGRHSCTDRFWSCLYVWVVCTALHCTGLDWIVIGEPLFYLVFMYGMIHMAVLAVLMVLAITFFFFSLCVGNRQ